MMEKARIKELKEECRVLMGEGKLAEAIRVYSKAWVLDKEKRPKKIDHEYTDEVVCPYCGEAIDNSDADETFGDDWGDGAETDFECGDCGRKFSAQMNVSVAYMTKKIEQESEVPDGR